jgi:hypothetical protein
MTVRHIVFFDFPNGRNDAYMRRLNAGLAELVAEVPAISSASWGDDITDNDANYDFALVMDFADRDAYQRYRTHPAHLRFIEAFMREVPTDKVRVQYEFDDDAISERR